MKSLTLTDLIKLFPKIDPPFTLTDESIFALSKENKILPTAAVVKYVAPWEPDFEDTDDTEYIPCMQLSIQEDITSLIYWRGRALNYEYYLVNLDKGGTLMDRRLIAGLVVKGEHMLRLYVSVDEYKIFYVAGSYLSQAGQVLDRASETYSLEVLPSGAIISS